MDRPISLSEKFIHLLCPLLIVLFPSPFQFSKVMGIAQRMRSAVLEIRFPVVVAKDSSKNR